MAAFPRPTALAVSFLLLLAACSGPDAQEPSPSPSAGTPTPATPTAEPSVVVTGATLAEPSYTVALRGNGGGTRWRGTQEVSFMNTGDAPIRKIWFRAWANGVDGCDPSAIDVSAVVGGDLGRPQLDCTALPVRLPEVLDPGERATVGFDLAIAVPERNDRFGTHQGLALMGNALPTLAVHEEGEWHLDPYVDVGDSFYSVVGRYRVALDVPSALQTAATGSLVSSTNDGNRVVRTYAARDVRDFAWAAGDLDVVRGDADGVAVTIWYQPSFMTAPRARMNLRDAVQAMTTYSEAFGAYPYGDVDVVMAAFTSFGGMEYPRLVFSNPERRVLAHELAHQWWYAVVGNDQYAEPWLDESFATWASMLPWQPWSRCPAYRWPSPSARLTNDMGYWGGHRDEYQTVYEGGGCMLADLADRFGLQRFISLLRAHARSHWLGVTTTSDFQRRVERAADRHLDGFDAAGYWETWRVG